MTDTQDTNSRIDADRPSPEASPSAGWRATAELMHVIIGLEECDVLGCDREGDPLKLVDVGADTDAVLREGVRGSDHSKGFLEVTS
jgi:hypothetical protein